MPRISRIVIADVPFHVTQRANRQEQVFFTDADRNIYLDWLRHYAEKYMVDILAYCLMTNHVHLVAVPSSADGLHRMLKPVHMRYAQRINRIKGKGHVWQGRFFSSALDEDYMWTAIRYVERNPIRAGIVRKAEDYRWSSASAHCGLRFDPVLTSNLVWKKVFQSIGDWATWVAPVDEPEKMDLLRRHANKGLPCGSPGFIEQFDKLTKQIEAKGTLPG